MCLEFFDGAKMFVSVWVCVCVGVGVCGVDVLVLHNIVVSK